MKRVLFINGSASPLKCGVGFYGERLINELSDIAYIHLLTTSPYSTNTIAKGRLHHVNKWGIMSLPTIANKIAKVSPDVIHIQYPAVGFGRQLGINLLPLYLRVFYRKAPIVLTLHEYHSSALLGRMRTVITALFVQKIIVSNSSDKQALPSLFKNRIAVVPIGSNIKKVAKNPKTLTTLLKKYHLDGALPTVVYFGFTNQAKGVHVLAEAAARIRANILLLTELSAHNPYQKQVLDAVDVAKKSGGMVAVTGYLSDAEVSEILQASDFFVLPQPLPITAKSGTTIAAAQHGLVIVSTASADADLNLPYSNGKNAVLLPNMNADDLSFAINNLIGDPSQLGVIKENLPALQEYFSWTNIAQKHIQLYDLL
ncbi:glycosyltransferase [bacterium]|nr:glycosyltransferase [bacterium]NDC94328.1 glycosyltransferase [bacterium]NDD85005.1 glycosyltransferase [bacterium]NDG32677.1 glycosyltransferase [bacterium]